MYNLNLFDYYSCGPGDMLKGQILIHGAQFGAVGSGQRKNRGKLGPGKKHPSDKIVINASKVT